MHRQSYQTLLLLILLSVFVCSAALTLYVQIQRFDQEQQILKEEEQLYLASAYLQNKLHERSASMMVSRVEIEGETALLIKDEKLQSVTYIYVHDGKLMEQWLSGEGEFNAEDGEVIASLDHLIIEEQENLYIMNLITDAHNVRVSVRR